MTMASTKNITLMLTDAGATKPTSPAYRAPARPPYRPPSAKAMMRRYGTSAPMKRLGRQLVVPHGPHPQALHWCG